MQVAAHSRKSIGVCLAAAGVAAAAPLVVPTSVPTPPAISTAAIGLTAAYNPLQPWIEAFKTASTGANEIGASFSEAPAVLLRQFLTNQAGYLTSVLKNPGSIGTVLGQFVGNAQAAFSAATLLGVDAVNNPYAGQESLDGWHAILLQSIPKLLPAGTPPAAEKVIKELLNVLSSPISGIAMGIIGPVVSPMVAVVNTLHKAITSLVAGNFAAAVQNLINMPANIVGAVLNGANMNLDGLVPLLNRAGLLAPGTTLHNLSIQFGGLFSAGATGAGMDGEPINIGGSIFNAVGMTTTTDLMGFPLTLEIPGVAIGPIAALVRFGQIIAKAIGWPGVTASPAAARAGEAELTNASPTALPSASAAVLNVSTETIDNSGAPDEESSAVGGSDHGANDDIVANDDDEDGDVDLADDVKPTKGPASDPGEVDGEDVAPAEPSESDLGEAEDGDEGTSGADDDEAEPATSTKPESQTSGTEKTETPKTETEKSDPKDSDSDSGADE